MTAEYQKQQPKGTELLEGSHTVPFGLFGFISTCHALTGAFLFARKPLFYACFVPFLVLADIVLCLIQSVLLDIR